MGEDFFIRYILSRPVPPKLLIDILRPASDHDLAPRVADAHSTHIRGLLRRERRSGAQGSRLTHLRYVPTVVPVDDELFQSLLEQVRELHRVADEVTRERARIDANVRARLRWDDHHAPPLRPQQRKVADEAVEALSKSRLSSSQFKQLYEAFFRRPDVL